MSDRLRAVGWSLLFLLGGYALGILLLILLGQVIAPLPPGSLGDAALETAALLVSYGLLSWLIGTRALHLTRRDLFGDRAARFNGLRGFGWGMALGTGLGGLVMLLAVALGRAAWRNDGGTVPQWLGTVVVTGLVLLPAAFAEELAFRGVPLITLAKGFGRRPAIVVLALLFGLAHLDNEHVTVLGLANIALAGILLGVVFFTPARLWTSTGVHLGWNLALAALAAPVSGTPLPMPWLDYSSGGPRWLTGGGFGPEGGVLASLCILGGILVARRRRKESIA